MADLFANALAYEELMGRWSTRLAPLFANFAKITDGSRVLDVGCGTGSLVRTVASMARQSEIVGIDPVQPFIEYARTHCADSRITFDRGNALDLPCPFQEGEGLEAYSRRPPMKRRRKRNRLMKLR